MPEHEKINYLEFPCKDLTATKAFFNKVFNWQFCDYGPQYSAFSGAGLAGGFYLSDLHSCTENGSALTVFYSNNIKHTQKKIEQAGGVINRALFAFPGGVRFHFKDPNGNEYAVWSEHD